MSLNPNFESDFDNWYKSNSSSDRANSLGRFYIGNTSKALKGIGIKDYRIYFGQSKIEKIMQKHSEMTPNIIKQVPQVLENPIIVMKSLTKTSDSITMYGELMGTNNKPVMISMLYDVKNRIGYIQNFGIVTSAYSRTINNTQHLINASDIIYVDPDKNRTDTWLHLLKLKLPSRITKYGFIGTI